MKRLLPVLLLAPVFALYAQTVLVTPGADAFVQEDEVSGFDFRAYRFTARAGQYYRVELDNRDVDFSLLPLKRGAAIPDGAEGYIPADGDYELRILQKRDAAQSGQTSRFRLVLTVNDAHSDIADAASHSSQIRFQHGSIGVALAGRLQGKAEDRYRFHANAGQHLRTQTQSEGVLLSLHYLGKGHDALAAGEQLLPVGGEYELRVALNRAAARRDKTVEYRIDMALDSVAADAATAMQMPMQATLPPQPAQSPQPAPQQALPAATNAGQDSLFIYYQCEDGSSHKVHYSALGSDNPRATVYFGERQYHLALSARHSTPAQVVFYGRNHYLALNTPVVGRDSRILAFSQREGETEHVLAANCIPQPARNSP